METTETQTPVEPTEDEATETASTEMPDVAEVGAPQPQPDASESEDAPVESDEEEEDDDYEEDEDEELDDYEDVYEDAIREIARVLKPGASAGVTVPRFWPERVCWALSEEYRTSAGGHVRIYREDELKGKLSRTGLDLVGDGTVFLLGNGYAPRITVRDAQGTVLYSDGVYRIAVLDRQRIPPKLIWRGDDLTKGRRSQ